MKLIDILVRDLDKFGGWPEEAVECHRFVDEANIDFYDKDGQWWDDCFLKYGNFAQEAVREKVITCESESVTREQYEAALAANKTEWDGVGLPPVGVNAEVFFVADTEPKWHSFLAKFIGENHVIALVGLEEISYKKDELLTSDVKFAPLRSEGDRKRDEVGLALYHAINWNAEGELVSPSRMEDYKKAFDAIAAGKIPLTASTATPYQLYVVKNATNQFPNRGALPFPAARHAPVARLIWSLSVSKGGLDGLRHAN